MTDTRHLSGNLLVLGLGSVGTTFLPMAARHFRVGGQRIAISAEPGRAAVAARHGFDFRALTLTADNFRAILLPLLVPGSVLVNLCVEVSSLDLIFLCRERDVLYVDTVTDPWPGVYGNPGMDSWQRSNACLRQSVRGQFPTTGATAIGTHGANPGWISHLVKRALLELAADIGIDGPRPAAQREWAQLACALGVRTLQIAERDWQTPSVVIAEDAVANTWSVDGFVAEAFGQAGEIGWGSHEGAPPSGSALKQGVVLLPESAGPCEVASWTPLSGQHQAMIVTHAESITLADYLTLEGPKFYRPTVYYAYRPIEEAWRAREWPRARLLALSASQKIVLDGDQIDNGIDELGVLLLGERFGAYWVGSRLGVAEAARLVPGSSATSLQVAAGVLAAVSMAIDEPGRGYLEPEDIDHEQALAICQPYLGPLVSVRSAWYPPNAPNDYRFERFLTPLRQNWI